MAKLESSQHLPHYLFHHILLQPLWVLFKVIQGRVVHVLKHEVQTPLTPEHFYEVHQIVMAKLLCI